MSRSMQFSSWVALWICLFLAACGQNNRNLSAELTPEEKAMPEAKYYSTDFAPVPDEVMDGIAMGSLPEEKILPFKKINNMLKPGYLEVENGYSLLDDGTAFVAVRTDLPGVTEEMLRWWFWWNYLEDVRYKIWCPGAHYTVEVEDEQRLADESLSDEERFYKNPHYPVEDIGSGPINLSIRFVPPENFGIDVSRFSENGTVAAACSVVGFRLGQVSFEHTNMCHFIRKKGDALEVRSRFWLGKRLGFPNIKKLIITEDLAMDMLLHCSQEFTHLAGFLPEIYDEFANSQTTRNQGRDAILDDRP